jgi:DNA-binding transcriptional regulator GbsR (MarR family)
MNEERAHYIQKIGVTFEKMGLPPLPGRIIGLLLVSEPPHLTFEEIISELQVSKSAVSNALKYLEMSSIVEYITFTGGRKRYFRLSTQKWSKFLERDRENISSFYKILLDVIKMRSNDFPEFNQSLINMCKFYEMLEEYYPMLIQKWHEIINEPNAQNKIQSSNP